MTTPAEISVPKEAKNLPKEKFDELENYIKSLKTTKGALV